MAKIPGHPGLFRPDYLDKTGKYVESSIIWGRWRCRGCPEHPRRGRHQISMETSKVKEADARLAEIKSTRPSMLIPAQNITVSWLLDRYLQYSETYNKRATYVGYRELVNRHLRPALGHLRATDLVYDDSIVERFVGAKKNEPVRRRGESPTGKIGYSNSRINSMLTLLAAAYERSRKQLAGLRPDIQKLEDHSARKEHFRDPETATLLTNMPGEIARPIQVMNITGWRCYSEVLSRKKKHLDWNKPALILEAGETKNKQPLVFPLFNEELVAILQEQQAVTAALEKEKGIIIPWLFHDPDGLPLVTFNPDRGQWKPTRYWSTHWKAALKAAGLVGRRTHDFRRSAIRRFGRCGIDDTVGQMLSGHRSARIYSDYKALREEDLFDAAKKIQTPSTDQPPSRKRSPDAKKQ